MGFFLSLLGVCLFMYLGVWGGIRFYAHFHQKFFLNHREFVEGIALYFALLFGIGIFSFMSVIPYNVVVLWGFVGIGSLSFSKAQLSIRKRIFFQYLLCVGSFLLLYQFSENALYFLLLAFLWWGMWRLIVWFDQFPLISFLTFWAWSMAFVITGLLIHTIPNSIIAVVSLLGTMTFLFSSFHALQKQPVLGPLVSSFLGFMWAGVWVYFLNIGAIFQTLTAFGYYLFEIVFLMVALFFHKPFQTFLTKSLIQSPSASKAVKTVFSHLLLLSFFATVMMHSSYASSLLLFALFVLLLDLYIRLNALVKPIPTWRELFQNTCKGLTDFVNQFKQKDSFSKKASAKKMVVSSKKIQKKPIKKKPTKKRKTKK